MTNPPTGAPWSTMPAHQDLYSTGRHLVAQHRPEQQTLTSAPSTRSANSYAQNLPPRAVSSRSEASYHRPSFPQGAQAAQPSYAYHSAYNADTYSPQYPRVGATPSLYTSAQMPGTIPPALPFWSDAGATSIHHSTAYGPATAYTDQYRDLSPTMYSPHQASSPGSPSSSSPSSYHSVSPHQLIGMPHIPESIPFFPADPVPRVPCLWLGCNVLLDDISTAGIKRHIRDWHADLSGTSHKDRRACLWDDGNGSVCGRELDAASFAKHIASVHLKSTAQECEYCHNTIGRADSLARHKRDHCPHRPRK